MLRKRVLVEFTIEAAEDDSVDYYVDNLSITKIDK